MGTGRVYFDDISQRYLIDLSVVSKYDTIDDLDVWEESFRRASLYLFEATLGQMQLGKVGFQNLGPTLDKDVLLTTETTHSFAFNSWVHRTPNHKSLTGYVKLTSIGKRQPLETTHELGHYVIGLLDEYATSVDGIARVCTTNAATGACIMEHAYNHGVVLSTDDSGVITTTLPAVPVTRFCYPTSGPQTSYVHMYCDGGAGQCGNNPQQQHHQKSCWNTLQEHFPAHVLLPGSAGLPTHAHKDVDWFVLKTLTKYSVAIFGHGVLQQREVMPQLKSSVAAWCKFISQNGNQFGMFVDTKESTLIRSFERNMAVILSEELPTLVQSIQELAGNSDKDQIPFGFDQFDQDNIAGSQFMFLIVPGDEPLEVPGLLESIADAFEERFITLNVFTVGDGPTAVQFEQLQNDSPRVNHVALPNHNEAINQNAIQSLLIGSYFEYTSNMGLVASTSGVLPVVGFRDVFNVEPDPEDVSDVENTYHLHLHPQSEGFDFPAYIEEGAQSAFFVLSQTPHAPSEFLLIQPNGEVLARDSNLIVKSSLGDDVQFYQVAGPDFHGRWILRVKRKEMPNEERQELTFHLLALAENAKPAITSNLEILGNHIRLKCSLFYDGPLDHIDCKVDIFSAEDYWNSTVPLQSIALQRETTLQRLSENQPVVNLTLSTGVYCGESDLPTGTYVAVFTGTTNGGAILANNTMGVRWGTRPTALPSIPAFSRVNRKFFSVRD